MPAPATTARQGTAADMPDMQVMTHPHGGFTVLVREPGSAVGEFMPSVGGKRAAKEFMARMKESFLRDRLTPKMKNRPAEIELGPELPLEFQESEQPRVIFTAAQTWTLDDIATRSREFPLWVDSRYESERGVELALQHGPRRWPLIADFLADRHDLFVTEHGVVRFETLTPEKTALIGDLPVMLFHHSFASEKEKVRNAGLPSGGGDLVLLTTDEAAPSSEKSGKAEISADAREPWTARVVLRLRDVRLDSMQTTDGHLQFRSAPIPPGKLFDFGRLDDVLIEAGAPGELSYAARHGRRLNPYKRFRLAAVDAEPTAALCAYSATPVATIATPAVEPEV